MTGAIFISDDLVQGLNLLKPIQAFPRVMSLSFGTISICIFTITSSNIQTNEIRLLCISSITLCNPCICTSAGFHFVLLQVLYLYYWKFCSCPIANSVFVLLKFYLLELLQIWYLYNCKFCICPIASSVFVLLEVQNTGFESLKKSFSFTTDSIIHQISGNAKTLFNCHVSMYVLYRSM